MIWLTITDFPLSVQQRKIWAKCSRNTFKYLNGIPADSRIRTSGIYLKDSNITPELLVKTKKLNDIAKERGETLAQMALEWVLNQPAVTSVLIGASRPEQIRENCKIVQRKPFTAEELNLIDDISLNKQSI